MALLPFPSRKFVAGMVGCGLALGIAIAVGLAATAHAQQSQKASIGAEVFDHTINGKQIEWFRVHTGPQDFTPKAKADMVRIGRLVRGGAFHRAGLGTGDFILSVRAGPVAGSQKGMEFGGAFTGDYPTREFYFSAIRSASDLAFALSQKKPDDQVIVAWSNAAIYPRSFFATVTLSAPDASARLEEIPRPPIASWAELAKQSFLDKERAYAGESAQISYAMPFDEWKARFKQDARPSFCSAAAKSGVLPTLTFNSGYKSKNDFDFAVIGGKTINPLTGKLVAPGAGSAIKTFVGMRQVLQAYQAALDASEIAVVNEFNRTGAISQASWNEYAYWVRKRHLSRGAMRNMSDQLQIAGMPDQAKIIALFFSGGEPGLWAIPESLSNLRAESPELHKAALALSFSTLSPCSPQKSATTEAQMKAEVWSDKGTVKSTWDLAKELAGTPERFRRLVDILEHRQYEHLQGSGGVFFGGFSWLSEARDVIAWDLSPPDTRQSFDTSFQAYRKQHDVEKLVANFTEINAKYLNAARAAEDARTYACWRKHGEEVIKYRFWSGPLMGGVAQGDGKVVLDGRDTSPETIVRKMCADPDHPLAVTDFRITVPMIYSGARGVMHDMNSYLDPFLEVIWP